MTRWPHHAGFLASVEFKSARYPGLDRAEKFPVERLTAKADTFRRSRASHRYRKAVRKNILELPTVRGAITSYHHRGFDRALPRVLTLVLPVVLPLVPAICWEPPPPPTGLCSPPWLRWDRLKRSRHSKWRRSNRI